LIDLLKLTDFYGVIKFKNKVEETIINGEYISVINVCEILAWSKESNALLLKDYCKKYIKQNWELVLEQKLEHCANAENAQEREEASETLESLLSDNS
jgi:hypothetical protein